MSCGHPSTYHGATFCMVSAGASARRACDCAGYASPSPVEYRHFRDALSAIIHNHDADAPDDIIGHRVLDDLAELLDATFPPPGSDGAPRGQA